MADFHVSERRIRQCRMAKAVFGGDSTIHYPRTREGWKAYWQHVRLRDRLGVWRPNRSRILPNAYMPGNKCFYDRVWLRSAEYRLWSFRHHSIFDTVYKIRTSPIPGIDPDFKDWWLLGRRLAKRYGLLKETD